MTDQSIHRRFRTALFASAAAFALLGAGHGQETDDTEALRAEIERLRALLESLSEKVDDQAEDIEEDRAEMEVMREELAITKAAIPDESQSTQEFSEREPGFNIGDTQVSYGGFLKLDFSVSRYSDGAPGTSDLGRDFFIPSLVPAAEGRNAESVVDFNPRESRFFFTTSTPIRDHTLTSRLEFDFQVTGGGDERVSNSFIPRIRQGWFQFDDWRFGMDWSTFQDVRALPEALDFIGPTEGTVFVRQPLVRYTRQNVGPGKLELAVEQPETTVTGFGGARIETGADVAPDWVARYTLEGDWGHVSLAGLGRVLRAGGDDLFEGSESQTNLAGGASFSGKINVGERDDIRFMATAGTGLGRYIGVNIVNAASIGADGNLDLIPSYSGFLAYRHFWSPKWRTNLSVGAFYADHPESSAFSGDPTDNSVSSHLNLLYSPVPNVTFGVEHIYARRGLVSDAVGTLNRIQFSARYGF